LGESFARRQDEPGILVEEDIFEEVFITEFTKTKVLVARAGSYITLDKAKGLGLI
jgi:uracil DNA glycosylase